MYAKHASASNKAMHLSDAILKNSRELEMMYFESAVGGGKWKKHWPYVRHWIFGAGIEPKYNSITSFLTTGMGLRKVYIRTNIIGIPFGCNMGSKPRKKLTELNTITERKIGEVFNGCTV